MERFKRKQDESLLANSKLLLRKTFDALQEAVFIIDAKTVQIIDCNSAASEMFGYSREEILGQTTSFLHVDEAKLQKFRDHLHLALREKGHLHLPEFRMKRKNGDIFITDHSVMPLEDDHGERIGWVSVIRDITERKLMLDELRRSEEKYRKLHESMRDGFVFVDMKGAIKDYNETYRKMLGYAADEIKALTYVDITPKKWHIFEQKIVEDQILPLGYSEVYEKEYIKKDGITFPVELRTFLIKDEEGGNEGMWAIVRDITDRKRAEELIHQSEERFRAFMDNSPAIAWMKDDQGRYVYLNKPLEERFGVKPGDWLGKTDFELWPQRTAELFRKNDLSVLNSGETIKIIETTPNPDGGDFFWRIFKFLIRSGEGQRYVGGIGVDITDRKQAETALRAGRAQLASLSANLADGMVYQINSGPSGQLHQFTYISPAVERLHGLTPEAVLQDSTLLYGQVIDEDRAFVAEAEARAFATKTKLDIDVRLRMPSGEVRWRRFISSPRIDQGRDWLWDGIELDISEQKLVQDTLLDGSQRVAQLGSWEHDLVNDVLRCSKEAYRIFGIQRQGFANTYEAFMEYVHPEDRAAVNAAYLGSMQREGETFDLEYRIVRRPGGEIRVIHGKCDHIRDSSGRIIRSVGIVQDITDRKRAEKKLEDAFNEIKQLKEKLEAENIYLTQEIRSELGFEKIIGESVALKHVLYRVSQVAQTDMTVLLLGETGTGKGLIAYAIHKGSKRREKPLIHVNCAALPSNLIESELFGREKGAYTGAESKQIGRFELADHGTIFLDEIGELSLELQAKLLRVIEEGKFERLGSPHTLTVDIRIIASTNRNLEVDIKKGRFREDLFYRLNVFPMVMPPLRERDGDIPLLVKYFLDRFNTKYSRGITSVSKSTMDALQSYPWPGNVRELASVIERAVITSAGASLKIIDNIDTSLNVQVKGPKNKNLSEVQQHHIVRVLEETGWKVEGPKGAAEVLGMNPSTLRTRMRKLTIKRPQGP